MTAPSGDAPLLVLVGSPLLGSLVWEPTASALRGSGHDVLVAPASGRTVLWSAQEACDDLLRAVPTDREVVLVVHSGAGLLAPLVAAQRPVVGVIMVDASLPGDTGEHPMAPPALLERIAPLADDDGVLPEWTRWWSEQEVAALFPPGPVRWEVESVQPRVALDYLRSTVVVPAGWSSRLPVAYLAFGDTYAEELARAENEGWPTARVDGRHLHQVVDPALVAAQICELLERLTPSGASG
ncbi:alpha/beta hydrolase [Aeromicrobium sp. CTD01-1L150]|uniref:alpha/beta hydrolase n=1 Tax=Aeromicrobium sp. CTD01-1L150 TaxID=3341830 RepID=UPI0035C12BB2